MPWTPTQFEHGKEKKWYEEPGKLVELW